MELNDKDNHIKLSKQLRDTHGVVKMMPGGSVAKLTIHTLTIWSQSIFCRRVR